MIYFVFAFTIWLKGPVTWLNETVHKAWFPGVGKSSILSGATVPMLVNRNDVVTFILGNLSPIFWNASVFESCDGFLFRVLRRTDQRTAKNDLEWRMHEVMGVVCGAMFGEKRMNNSVDLLSMVLVAFWVGQISVLVTVTHFCCNLLLQVLECYWTRSHARLACFLFETNQHFVDSARIAGLCLTNEVG